MSKTSVYDKLRVAEESPAWNRVSAFIIMKGAERVGQIKCKYPADGMGRLQVFLWDWTNVDANRGIQYGYASGCGYDKLAAAVDGLKFGELTFSDHPTDWKEQLRKAGYNLLQAI